MSRRRKRPAARFPELVTTAVPRKKPFDGPVGTIRSRSATNVGPAARSTAAESPLPPLRRLFAERISASASSVSRLSATTFTVRLPTVTARAVDCVAAVRLVRVAGTTDPRTVDVDGPSPEPGAPYRAVWIATPPWMSAAPRTPDPDKRMSWPRPGGVFKVAVACAELVRKACAKLAGSGTPIPEVTASRA